MSANWQPRPKRNIGNSALLWYRENNWLQRLFPPFDLTGSTHILDRTQIPSACTNSRHWFYQTGLNDIMLFVKFNNKTLQREKKAINCANTRVTAFFFPCGNRTCSICCLGSNMDTKSSCWWWRGDGKIISVAEEKFPLCEISDKHARPQPQNNVDQRAQTSGAMRLRPSEQRYLFIFFQDSKITSEDNRLLHMREHLEYQRFRLWHCSLPAYPPTCLSSNLCISTILAPTLTHSQAFVLMSAAP